MPPVRDDDAVRKRADDLHQHQVNGLRLALVELGAPGSDEAIVEVVFLNTLHVQQLLDELTAAPATIGQVFLVTGGHRRPAGPGTDQVRCRAVAAGATDDDGALVSLRLTIAPIGDYSTYRLQLDDDPGRIDPFFSEIAFKFRPGCFASDCDPAPSPQRPTPAAPAIDYLAKDFDSFRHTLITAMSARVPGWRVTSEADLDQVLIDLFAAAADELSDYQDRTIGEAYLETARKRVSLARHARLVDYHVHQGHQASTWLVVLVADGATGFAIAPEELIVWAGHPEAPADRVFFATRERRADPAERIVLDPLVNELALHTWSDAQPALRAGSTSADLISTTPSAGQAEAEKVASLVRQGALARLVLEEKRNPLTGRPADRDPRKRQLLRLTGDAQPIFDPVATRWCTRVSWRDEDALRSDYSFTTTCPRIGREPGVSAFHGNVVRVHQGRPVTATFSPPDVELAPDTPEEAHRQLRARSLYGRARGVTCELPFAPLAYLPTPPGGEVPPRSTLHVVVVDATSDPWEEVATLVHSDDSAEEGDHFVVETDEHRRSTLRFGDGVNGRRLPERAVVHCEYQVGDGAAGNVGAGSLTQWRPLASHPTAVTALWNPFDVTDGCAPEPVEKVLRNAPEAYATRQLRAITLADYARRAEEVPGVSRAVAQYAWTGSWRTVRIVVDPVGTTELDDDLLHATAEHLAAVRLLGEDLEIRPPRLVPLTVDVKLCLHPDFWPSDVRVAIERELSDGWTPDGRRGFFHPDEWTFGQPLHRSALAGRIHAVGGVEHVVSIAMARFDARTPGDPRRERLDVRFDEIVLVRNDPDHRELGTLELDLVGGRQ